ncbi:hypothetical protein G6F31_021743 [Rhizopus arrhizus]|nr:hypothetical protein G6F31_021743 [Rhizopus arrhizus]
MRERASSPKRISLAAIAITSMFAPGRARRRKGMSYRKAGRAEAQPMTASTSSSRRTLYSTPSLLYELPAYWP